MKTKVLVDINVILDVMLCREPHWKNSKRLLEMIEDGKVRGYVAPHTVTNVFYLVEKYRKEGKKAVRILLEIFNLVSADKKLFSSALNIDLEDYENALQVACARKVNVDYLVTRDKKLYRKCDIKAVTPEEFLDILR